MEVQIDPITATANWSTDPVTSSLDSNWNTCPSLDSFLLDCSRNLVGGWQSGGVKWIRFATSIRTIIGCQQQQKQNWKKFLWKLERECVCACGCACVRVCERVSVWGCAILFLICGQVRFFKTSPVTVWKWKISFTAEPRFSFQPPFLESNPFFDTMMSRQSSGKQQVDLKLSDASELF